MSEMPGDVKKSLEIAPDIVKRQVAEVMRIHDNGSAQNEAEENFIHATLELDWAMKNLRKDHPYVSFVFEVISTYLYDSPEKVLEMTWQRAAEFSEGRFGGAQ